MVKLRVGDTVKVDVLDRGLGVIKYIDSDGSYAVEHEKKSNSLHNCYRHCKNNTGWWYHIGELTFVSRGKQSPYQEVINKIKYLNEKFDNRYNLNENF
jgi:hypothetical protein